MVVQREREDEQEWEQLGHVEEWEKQEGIGGLAD